MVFKWAMAFIQFFWNNFRSGLSIFIPLALVVFFSKFVFRLLIAPVSFIPYLSSNPFLSLLAAVVLIFLLGISVNKTSLVEYLQEKFENRKIILKILNFFFRREKNKKPEMEILYYFTPTLRVRGVIKGQILSKDEKWFKIHFCSPPAPYTGMTILEIKSDDENLKLTGRTGVEYASYVLSYGDSLTEE